MSPDCAAGGHWSPQVPIQGIDARCQTTNSTASRRDDSRRRQRTFVPTHFCSLGAVPGQEDWSGLVGGLILEIAVLERRLIKLPTATPLAGLAVSNPATCDQLTRLRLSRLVPVGRLPAATKLAYSKNGRTLNSNRRVSRGAWKPGDKIGYA